MKKILFFMLILVMVFSLIGCGGGSKGSGGVKVSINLQAPTQSDQFGAKSLGYNEIRETGKYATYITCDLGTNFNGGYAPTLNQRISLVARITDSAGNLLENVDHSQISWLNPDPANIFPSYLTGEGTQLDIRKVGKYTVTASYQGNVGTCQVITYNSTYLGNPEGYPGAVIPAFQGVILNDDDTASLTNDLSNADLYMVYNEDIGADICTIVAPNGAAILPIDTWDQIDFVYLYQFGNIKTVPEGLTYTTDPIDLQVGAGPQTLIVKKRDNSGFVKLVIDSGNPNLASIAYVVSSGNTFPLSFD
jgi:hypothetical protein